VLKVAVVLVNAVTEYATASPPSAQVRPPVVVVARFVLAVKVMSGAQTNPEDVPV
jgi:hypothetical protein